MRQRGRKASCRCCGPGCSSHTQHAVAGNYHSSRAATPSLGQPNQCGAHAMDAQSPAAKELAARERTVVVGAAPVQRMSWAPPPPRGTRERELREGALEGTKRHGPPAPAPG